MDRETHRFSARLDRELHRDQGDSAEGEFRAHPMRGEWNYRVGRGDGAMEATIELGANRSSAAAARSFVRAKLAEGGRQDLCENAALLTSELVANAILHARSAVDITVRLGADGLRVAVLDDNTEVPTKIEDRDELEGGRGLLLVDALADSWGVSRGESRKAVWFEVA